MQSQARRSGAEERKLGQKGCALDSLDVEADCGDGGHDLAKLELVQDGGLASSVKADHQDAHILLAEQLAEDLGEGETHGDPAKCRC